MNELPPKFAKSNGKLGRRGLQPEVKARMIDDYLRLRSLAKTAKLYGRTRQTMQVILKAAGCKMYPVRPREHVMVEYKGRTFTPGKGGYLRDTRMRKKAPGLEVQLQRQVWVDHHGPIPEGYEIILLDHNKANCKPSNISCLPRREARKHNAGGENQFTKARREQRVKDNMGWLYKEAHRLAFAHKGISVDDLVQQGVIGIMKADKTYDPKYGTKFLSWATLPIRAAMQRWIENHSRTIRIPTNRFYETSVPTVSLHEALGDDSDATLEQFIGIDETVTEERNQGDRAELLKQAVATLTPRQQHILHGLFWEGKTQDEVALELGLTRGGVHMAKQKALRQLRKKSLMRTAA